MTAADFAPGTAHVLTGYRPEDGFLAAELDPPPAEYVWHDENAEQQDRRYGPGVGYQQWLAVDARDGAVWFGDTDWRAPQESPGSRLPGIPRKALGDGAVPDPGIMVQLLGHLSHDEQRGCTWRFFDAGELHALAVGVLPAVQRLVDSIHRIGPEGELEWSAEAATAWDDIEHAATPAFDPSGELRWPRPRTTPVPAWRVEVDAFLAANPELCEPSWAVAPDAELDAYADYRPATGYGGVPGRTCHAAERHIEDGFTFYGHRAALYAYRARASGGRTPTDARTWLETTEAGRSTWEAARPPGATLADVPDYVLTDLTDRFQNSAREHGLVLTGLDTYLRNLRAGERAGVDQQLRFEGREVERLENLLKEFRAGRNRTLTRILAWSDGRSDAEIAGLASLPDEHVTQWRARLNDEQTTTPPAP
ncbi:hypothetical protein [Streptomyces lavendulae]|uniref:hypothetical protein n=1 Tax=Streptomyces lavendulae TaxID=1914 RepID=UPI0024A496E8|nr:hypothetical protein [Streptomyces lavendulae]GLX16592.1 hypothetical protein Slala01_02360 [Streptomyces lavendulae subsp. lavendulae]GLX25212.1 hypothetical protein Slala02_10320 [Streptomyces lavendulae subsp. lavendulae]